MTATTMCGEVYERISEGAPQHVRCTYLVGHRAEHSWFTLQQSDEAAKVVRATAPAGDGASVSDITVVLHKILSGEWDAYIEAILGVTHDRKRSLRGVRTYPDLLDPQDRS